MYSPLSLGALATGWRATLGVGANDACEDLSSELGRRFAADVVTLTDSGTSALAIAIAGALRGRHDAPVALPAYCCYDVATAAAAAHASVLLYDIDAGTLGPDWPSLERALADGAAAVVVAHLFGLPVDMERASRLCTTAGAVLIEDAAQGIGARLGGRVVGSLAPLSVLSFGRGKGVTGGAGGALLGRQSGAVLTAEAQHSLAGAMGGARALAAASAQWLLGRPSIYALPAALPFLRLGETVYRSPHAPRALGSGPAALAVRSLASVADETAVRRSRASRLEGAARAGGVAIPAPVAGSEPGYLRFPMLLEGRVTSDAAALGIAHGYPLALPDVVELRSRCRNVGLPVPGARTLAARLYTAPTHSRLSEPDVQRLVAWIGDRGREGSRVD